MAAAGSVIPKFAFLKCLSNFIIPRYATAKTCDAAPDPVKDTQCAVNTSVLAAYLPCVAQSHLHCSNGTRADRYVAAVHRGCATHEGKGTYGRLACLAGACCRM